MSFDTYERLKLSSCWSFAVSTGRLLSTLALNFVFYLFGKLFPLKIGASEPRDATVSYGSFRPPTVIYGSKLFLSLPG